MTLAAKYTKLKKAVGGNRERMHYEESFGQPMEEQNLITMPNQYIRRILAQTEFSIRLSKSLGGIYDADVEKCLDFLQDAMDRDGVLTKSVCADAEEYLMPLAGAAKEYTLILAAHAHIDMNWMWSWHETVAATIATFQTMLKLMEEYPEFCFSQSQGSVYQIIERYAPEMKPLIEKRIREGRWEVTASAWVETDKNMPSTESLLQHIHYTKKYMKEHWGIDPETLNIDFSPDTFGHSANLPELDKLGGVKYYYHCRGLDGDNALYRWRSPSGSEMIVYREQYWYNSGITPLPAIGLIDTAKRCGGFKTGLVVYGVGDHGGGPTRRDIERGLEMQQWPVFPKIKFGTFGEFFALAETVREKLPVVDHELNFILSGCYTTQSRIKLANRRCEAALFDAQLWDTFARCEGVDSEEQFEDAWRKVLFTHFHDILTGSCVQDSREHAMGLFTEAMATANTRASMAMQKIASQLDTSMISVPDACDTQSEGGGVGYGVEHFAGVPSPERGKGLTRIYHVFNSASVTSEKSCEITVWDWVGDMREISVTLADGTPVPHQLLDTQPQKYWDHRYFRILVQTEVPAFGYTTVVLSQKEPEEYRYYRQPAERTKKEFLNPVLENEYLRAEFDIKNGELISLIDKVDGKEKIRTGESGGLRCVITERASSDAWNIGRYQTISDPFDTSLLRSFSGPISSGFEMEQKVMNSEIKVRISLEQGARHLDISVQADWNECSRHTDPVPLLIYRLPLEEVENYLYDVPGGALYREERNEEVPGLQYGAAVSGDRAVAVVTDSKYGYRGYDRDLISSLINSTYSPDPYPERGIHHIKLHILLAENCPKVLEDQATEINHPLAYQSGSSHEGTLPAAGAFLKAELGTAVISGISTMEGDLTVRVFETCGTRSEVSLTFCQAVPQEAYFCDIMGEKLEGKIEITGNGVRFALEANTSAMVRVKF